MTPDESLPSSSPTPEPAPAPPAPPAPEPLPPPEPGSPPEPTVEKGQFDAMASLLSRGPSPLETIVAESPRDQPSRPAASPSPASAQPTPTTLDAPKRWADRFQTPEELERAYKDISDRFGRSEQATQKLERLLLASLEARPPQQPAHPAAPPRPVQPRPSWDQQTALTAIREEAARLGLDDPQADPQRFIRAIAAALREDEEARSLYVAPTLAAIDQRNEHQRQIQMLQQAFYTQYPDLQQVRPDLLREVAVQMEARLAQAAPHTYGSPEFVKSWFEETAREARQVFRVPTASATGGASSARTPSPLPSTAPKASSAKPQGAPFAESPSPRPTEPALTGQDFHLNRVFARRG
jgi:hypothetical protein